MQDTVPFGQQVHHYRHALGLTQAALAERVNCAIQTIRKLEAGHRRPSFQMAARLAQMLELTALERVAFMQAIPTTATQAAYVVAAPQPTAVPQSLPTYLTPFLGREQEQAELAQLLALPDHRLISLVGPGGIGKTRLAVEVAAHAAGFADGVVFVSLTAIDTPNQIASTIGDILNLPFAGQPDLLAYLISYLRDRHMLLVLDNFEHLLAGVDLIVAMLTAAPRVTMLVTSRERLNLQAEWLFDVDGLSYPVANQPESRIPLHLADPAEYSAVQLFMQRAAQVQARLPLTTTDLASIVRICQYLAGMPLAIELAAASVHFLPIDDIEQRIHANLDALTTTLRDVPGRHRSMRAVFDHSWSLLDEAQRALFRRLAVFRGGWTVEAARRVTGVTLPALAELDNKSLLRSATAHTGRSWGMVSPIPHPSDALRCWSRSASMRLSSWLRTASCTRSSGPMRPTT